MKKLYLSFSFLICTLLVGCAILKPVQIIQNESLYDYQYFYVMPTNDVNSSSGGVYGGVYGLYGSSSSKSVNPADIITGKMMKNGFTRLDAIDETIADKTIIISYGESGRRTAGLGYTIEITIQFTNAATRSLICSCTGEGQGESETDDIRKAVNRSLDELFSKLSKRN
ncbi:MAG: hypothetical protein MJZ91_06215 [Bacteroidales bacterium]|nr:hypothetical protein [Bacteroidales bacterium]